MPSATIEERLTLLEQKVAHITVSAEPGASPKPAWWKRLVGVYKNDPEFVEAERLGREYRESLRPQESSDAHS